MIGAIPEQRTAKNSEPFMAQPLAEPYMPVIADDFWHQRLRDIALPPDARSVMPKYFLHLRDSIDEVLDPEGIELPPEAVAGAALLAARDCMANDVKLGRLDLHYRIDVHAEDGELVHTLKFSDALEIAPER